MELISKLTKSWRQARQQRREMLTFAVLIGYNTAAGGLHLIDPLAQRQFWKPQDTGLLHSYPMPSQAASYLMPVEPGKQTTLQLPNKRTAQLSHSVLERQQEGGRALVEQIEISGIFDKPFIYQRRYNPDGAIEVEARLGDKFHNLSARSPEADHAYVREIKRLAAIVPTLAT